MVVYLITNLIDGKQYVGRTIQSMQRRWHFHTCKRSGCVYLHSAIKKYGKDNFKIEQIYEASSKEELCAKEKEFILLYNTLAPNGYNLTTGGEDYTVSEETRKRMSSSKLGIEPWNKGLHGDSRIIDAAVTARKAMREIYGDSGPHKGHKHSEKTKEQISISRSGIFHSKETKKQMSDSHEKTKIMCDQNGIIYNSIMEASRSLNLNSGNIQKVANGKAKHVKGYTFKKV